MNKATRGLLLAGAVLLAIGPQGPAAARLKRIVVDKIAPAAPVKGAARYEIVSGRFYGELNPADPHNAIITDIAYAPRNARGMVDYSATFAIARPIDGGSSADILFYDVANRGNTMLGADPFGYVRVVSGWQGDLPEVQGLQTARVPVAAGPRGAPLTGPVLVRFVDMKPGSVTLPITGSIGRPTARPLPVSLDTRLARLVRQRTGAGRSNLRPRTGLLPIAQSLLFPASPILRTSASDKDSIPPSPTR